MALFLCPVRAAIAGPGLSALLPPQLRAFEVNETGLKEVETILGRADLQEKTTHYWEEGG